MKGSLYENDADYFTNPPHIFKLIEDGMWDKVVKECQLKNNAANQWVVRKCSDGTLTWRRLPIHEASIRKPTEDAVMALLAAYPDGALSKDQNGRVPLHHACVHGASAEVVEVLLMAYPGSLDVEDMWEKTPVSTAYASASINKHEIIKLLEKGQLYWVSKREDKKLAVLEGKQQEKFEEKVRDVELKHKKVIHQMELVLMEERSTNSFLKEKLNDSHIKEAALQEQLVRQTARKNEDEATIAILKQSENSLRHTVKKMTQEINSLLEKSKTLDIRVKEDTETIKDLRKCLLDEQVRAADLEEQLKSSQKGEASLRKILSIGNSKLDKDGSVLEHLRNTGKNLENNIKELQEILEHI